VTCPEDNGRKRHLFCFDRTDGKQLWVKTVAYTKPERTHGTNPQCASTPVSDGERIVVWYGSAGMYCYDLDGNDLWSRDLGEFEHIWGYGSSPIIYRGKVIHLCGPGERTFMAAFDLKNGATLWETPEPGGESTEKRPYVGSWATPVVISIDGRDQILCGLPTRAAAYDPEDGKVLWHVDGVSGNDHLVYTSPMVGGDVALILGGFGGPGIGLRLGGSGDVTESNRLWRVPRNPQRIGSGVVIGKHLFMANADNEGSIQCIDIETGDVVWQERRTSEGSHWGSVVLAGGHLYVTGQKGITRVFKPNPEQYEVVAENDLGENSNSTPAVSDGEIFLRTFKHLYCVASQ
jgi:outer membrane protein assembly factor BamB